MPPPIHGAALVGQSIYESEKINAQWDCYYVNASVSNSVNLVGKIRLKKLWSSICILSNIFRFLLTKNPKLCYYTATLGEGPGIYVNVAIVSILKLFRRKIVLHLHNRGCKRALTYGKKYHYAYSFIFHNTKVILLAPQLYDDIKDYVDISNVHICPNGIKDQKDEIKKTHNDIPHILFLSNLIVEKGVFTLLDSLSVLHEQGIKFKCSIVGNETLEVPTKRIIEEITSRNLQYDVFYLGKKYGNDKELCYQEADVFVFPTYYPGETFGLVLLEAMQHHLPCISTNIGGIPNVVDHKTTGLLCNPNNVKELTISLLTLLQDKEKRISMGEEGYKKYKSTFTLEHFERSFISILNTIIKES